MRVALILTLLAAPAVAQDIGAQDAFSCEGADPDWAFEADGDTAVLDYLRTSDLSLMLVTAPDGMDWPKAYTYIGRGDSAIVIREATQRDNSSKVRILTQRGETPLLLIGKCYAD